MSASGSPERGLEVDNGGRLRLGLLGGQEAPVPLEGGQERRRVD